MPEETILNMSDAFENRKVKADVELRVRMLNINYGRNQKLMEKCRALAEYAEFVEISREYIVESRDYQEALNLAIDYCIDNDILSEFLRRYRAEVLGMLLEEFDVDKYERSLREEGREEGLEEGREEGSREMLIKNVEAAMKNFGVDLGKACEGLGVSIAEYEEAKRYCIKE